MKLALIIVAAVLGGAVVLGMELRSTMEHFVTTHMSATNDAHRINAGKVGHGK